MSITLSKKDYATAWKLITSSSNHDEHIEKLMTEKLLAQLPENPTLLDVGAGSGVVSKLLRPHFSELTLVEQSGDQVAEIRRTLPDVTVFVGDFADFPADEQFDVVLCSHVLYHVPRAEWGAFFDALLKRVRPGGFCLVLLVGGATDGAGHPLDSLSPQEQSQPVTVTTSDHLRKQFTDSAVNMAQFLPVLAEKNIDYELISNITTWAGANLDEIDAICRFVVFEDCLTPDYLAGLTEEQSRALDKKIRDLAAQCPQRDGHYLLEMEDQIVVIHP